VSRRQRQREEIIWALTRRHYARVLVLSREHLAEFPEDRDVRVAADVARQQQQGHATSGEG
jgi:hypothetical protein